MADKEPTYNIYLGEPSRQTLKRIEGNIVFMRPLAAADTCCSCACGSCSCNCTCNACGSCYCSCSCCSREDLFTDEIFKRVEDMNSRLSEVTQILANIRAGLKLG